MSVLLFSMLLAAQNVSTGIAQCDRVAFETDQKSKRLELTNELRTLIDRQKQVGEERMQIANRLGEIAQGGLGKKVKGTFDPDYNAASLRGRDYQLEQQQTLIQQQASMIGLEINLLEADRQNFDISCGITNAPDQ